MPIVQKSVDPLSSLLSLLELRCLGCGGFDFAGDVSIDFPVHDGIKCYSLVCGNAWLIVEGVDEHVHLSAGDCLVLPRGMPFRIATALGLPPVDYRTLLANKSAGSIKTFNGGGDCLIVGSYFELGGRPADLLLSTLPPIVRIRSESSRKVMLWCLERIMEELRGKSPGRLQMADYLAQMMFIQALRLYSVEEDSQQYGLLFALTDKRMSVAIAAIHESPAFPWTVENLGQICGMSRTTFSQKFRALAGMSPMSYVTQWRMAVAGERLVEGSESVGAVGNSLGYESESSFRTAFKRVMGLTPRAYVRSRMN